MPNWDEVLEELRTTPDDNDQSAIDIVRRKYLRNLSKLTGRNSIAYYSGFLSKGDLAGVEINDEDKNGFMLCVHEMNRSKGLDLILHTPGGAIAATESLVHYLREMFGKDVRAIVPQIAMSGGTMLACSCKSILMGKQSNLGPTDPQINGFPAVSVKAQFDRAFSEIIADERAAAAWEPMLRQLGPAFLQECDYALEWASEFVEKTLSENMLSSDPNVGVKSKEIAAKMLDPANKGHDKHFHYQECIGFGLDIELLESDDDLQDAVLTVHHCYMHTVSNTNALKVIENQLGRALIKSSYSQ